MKKVLKWSIGEDLQKEVTLTLPGNSALIHLEFQNGDSPVVWSLSDFDDPLVEIEFYIAPTGEELPAKLLSSSWIYLGSVQRVTGQVAFPYFVVHVWFKPEHGVHKMI